MNERKETTNPKFFKIVTGHFYEEGGYENWRSHGTNDWLLIYTVSGSGRFGTAGGSFTTRAGDVTLFRPQTPQEYATDRTAGQWELLWAHFHPRPHWHEWLDLPEIAPGLMRLKLPEGETRREIESCLQTMEARARGAHPRREAFALNALEAALLLCDAVNPRTSHTRLDGRVQQAMDFLCARCAEPVGVADTARHCGLSVSRLSHLFREQVGMTPMHYLELQRLDRARQLLELTSRTVQAIAEEVGFDSPFYFSARFKRWTGFSPRDYRARL